MRLKWRGLPDSAALYQSVLVSTDVHRDVYNVIGNSLSTHDEREFPLTFMLWRNGGGQLDMRVLTYLFNQVPSMGVLGSPNPASCITPSGGMSGERSPTGGCSYLAHDML